ncbi:MAG TPA: AAA family ATPase [Acidimicrobiales bacterium]|nr:AAA family ATPase [Acidimicrobiales bacterium]
MPTDALSSLGGTGVAAMVTTDVGAHRQRARSTRLQRLAMVLAPVAILLILRDIFAPGASFPTPHFPSSMTPMLPAMILITVLLLVMVVPLLAAGRSPHILYRPDELTTGFDDVRGSEMLVEEVTKTLNLFLAHQTFADQMGGSPRKAILFEGPPGTGKTYMAKAMAAEAGVPFLFVSSSAFQSMFYGQTNRKIRAYFKQLRRHARREGGAIGFIEELDAIGAARGSGPRQGEGIPGVVNELLIQLQSFEQTPFSLRLKGMFIDAVNTWLPAERRLRKPKHVPANILVIGATNRAADLDPALLRPGRFDRNIYFGLPGRAGRRDIIDYYLGKKAHDDELDEPARRETLAALTAGYSPVMIEHLMDESLVWALRRGANKLSWSDLQHAKMTEEIGLAQPVEYTEAERRTIATHEAGHATVAWLVGKGRKLEVLTIIKRKDALGLLSHSEEEERFTKTKTEVRALIDIAFGGMVAEELFFGEASTGVASDLQAATLNACQMVGLLGMGTTLISSAAMEYPAGGIVSKVLATDGGRAEVEDLLGAAKASVTQMLDEHREVVEALRDALLEREELIGDDILDVIRSAQPLVPVAGLAGSGALISVDTSSRPT